MSEPNAPVVGACGPTQGAAFPSPEDELRQAVRASRDALSVARLGGAAILAGPRHFFNEMARLWEEWLRRAGVTRVTIAYAEPEDRAQPGQRRRDPFADAVAAAGCSDSAQLFVVAHCYDVPPAVSPRCVALYTEHELPERPAHGTCGRFRVAWHFSQAYCRPLREMACGYTPGPVPERRAVPPPGCTMPAALLAPPRCEAATRGARHTPQLWMPITLTPSPHPRCTSLLARAGRYWPSAFRRRPIDVLMPLNTDRRRSVAAALRRAGLCVEETPWHDQLDDVDGDRVASRAKVLVNVHAHACSQRARATASEASLPPCDARERALESSRVVRFLTSTSLVVVCESGCDDAWWHRSGLGSVLTLASGTSEVVAEAVRLCSDAGTWARRLRDTLKLARPLGCLRRGDVLRDTLALMDRAAAGEMHALDAGVHALAPQRGGCAAAGGGADAAALLAVRRSAAGVRTEPCRPVQQRTARRPRARDPEPEHTPCPLPSATRTRLCTAPPQMAVRTRGASPS